MATLIVQMVKGITANQRAALISDLSTYGTVEQLSAIPRCVFVHGPASAAAAIESIPVVMDVTVETPDDFVPMSDHQFVPLGPEFAGQMPIVLHGNRRGELFNSPYDLIIPGQAITFRYDATAGGFGDGTGVNIYVVDAGIAVPHDEFPLNYGGQLNDQHGDGEGFHGTAVASCAAGVNLGVAPGATVFDCKGFPFDGGTSSSNLITSMNAALTHYNANSQPGVINCSFGGTSSVNSYSTVIDSCIDAGLVVVASAGNAGLDLDLTSGSSNTWPAEDPDCITVGGTDSSMRLHEGSNHHGTVDIYALYQHWTTADQPGPSTYRTPGRIRGTSFSGPMVAGAVARDLSGGSKLADRAAFDLWRANFLANWGEFDMADKDDTPLTTVPRLYIPGVSRLSVDAYSYPDYSVAGSTPLVFDFGITHLIMGGGGNRLATRGAQANLIMGASASRIATRNALTHVILEP